MVGVVQYIPIVYARSHIVVMFIVIIKFPVLFFSFLFFFCLVGFRCSCATQIFAFVSRTQCGDSNKSHICNGIIMMILSTSRKVPLPVHFYL